MSLSAYPNLRLKITPQAALKLRFLPAIPGSNAAAAEAAAAASAVAANSSSINAALYASAASSSSISAALSAAGAPQYAISQVISFAADAAHSKRAAIAALNSATAILSVLTDSQIALKSQFFS